MTRIVTASAPAKVNLALRVGGPRPDGFHPLDTVFEALSLYEDIEVREDPSGQVSVEYRPESGAGGADYASELPVDERNLAVRAALILQERYGVSSGARMTIVKRIPVAGGMAGGSADAAAALVALNALWELDLSEAELMSLGAELGSDVPFALMGGTARGRGRGDELSRINQGSEHGFVMLINPVGLSTPAVFREFDRLGSVRAGQEPQSTARLIDTLAEGSLEELGSDMINDLEAPAFSLRPDLGQIVGELRSGRLGERQIGEDMRKRSGNHAGGQAEQAELAEAIHAVILSGSGPTIAVLCDPAQVEELREDLAARYPRLRAVGCSGSAHGALQSVVVRPE